MERPKRNLTVWVFATSQFRNTTSDYHLSAHCCSGSKSTGDEGAHTGPVGLSEESGLSLFEHGARSLVVEYKPHNKVLNEEEEEEEEEERTNERTNVLQQQAYNERTPNVVYRQIREPLKFKSCWIV